MPRPTRSSSSTARTRPPSPRASSGTRRRAAEKEDAMGPSRPEHDFRERYGPWALVAGASDGIGECFARRIAAEGVNVLLLARREPLLAALAGELRAKHGVEARTVLADLTASDLDTRVHRKSVEEGTRVNP